MTPDTILQIGDFEFSRYEVPEHIPFGGEQRLVVHRMVGGKRNIQAMGFDPKPIDFSGMFFGETALERALYLKTLAESGEEVELIWSELYYLVVIKSFEADFERFYQLPYRISVEVVEDLTTSVAAIASANVDDMINQDQQDAMGLSDLIGDGTLSSLMGVLDVAISQVSDFAKAAQSNINSVLQPLSAVRSRVQLLTSSVNNTLSNVTTIGGIQPNTSISQNVSRLLGQVNAATQLPSLLQMDSVLGRMGRNLGTINSGTKSLITAGSNLYRVAANEYGDAMGWTAIANANGVTDPSLSGINTVVIPPFNQDTGGVLNA